MLGSRTLWAGTIQFWNWLAAVRGGRVGVVGAKRVPSVPRAVPEAASRVGLVDLLLVRSMTAPVAALGALKFGCGGGVESRLGPRLDGDGPTSRGMVLGGPIWSSSSIVVLGA